MKAIGQGAWRTRYPSWLEFGKDLSQAFTTLRLAGESVSDSEKFNKLRDMPFFQDFGDVALWEAMRIGSWRQHRRPSTVVIREGDQGDSVYLLIEGEVGVTLMGKPLDHHQARRLLRRGSLFRRRDRPAHHHHRRRRTRSRCSRSSPTPCAPPPTRCQVAFNKAFMRVLIDRLTQANLKLAKR